MIKPDLHPREKERLSELESYGILDTLPEKDYDNLTAIASLICGTPISLISLIDSSRQWFKSHLGLEAVETSRDFAFCAHAINDQDNVLIVEDATKDERFKDNPLVTGEPRVIFYAGIPLVTGNGMPLGTICVIDHQPKKLEKIQLDSLAALRDQVIRLLELRRNQHLLESAIQELEESNNRLAQFNYLASHDLREPLRTIMNYIQVINEDHPQDSNPELKYYLQVIQESASRMDRLVHGLLRYSRLGNFETPVRVDMNLLVKEVLADLHQQITESGAAISIDSLPVIMAPETGMRQVMQNLVSNAIKFRKPDVHPLVKLGCNKGETTTEIYVQDNGIGIEPRYFDKIFHIFQKLNKEEEFEGYGIGLAICKKIISLQKGDIRVESEPGNGSRFTISLPNNRIWLPN